MAAALVVPTIFTAVDKISGVVSRMQRSVGGFAGKASIGVNALNKGLNSLLPSLGGLGRQLLHMAQAAIIFGGVAFSFKTILDYEKALAHLHGLLNTLSDSGFKPYQKEVDRVARTMQYGAAGVADAFTKIAERNIALAKTPESLGAVTQAAITLSRDAKMELVPAIDALVNVLFQFGLAGKDSNRVINVLSAGMVRGSSTIENQIEAYKKFAVTARGANLTLEQSQALIQTVAHQVQGSDAGTALRNIILNLERYKQVYKNGKFDIGYALDKTAEHLVRLGTEQKQNIFLQDLFGKRQVNVARQILENIPLYERLTKEVTNTSEAQRLSAKNVDNVYDAWGMLVAQYQNYITSSDKTLKGLQRLKGVLRYVANNLDNIIGFVIEAAKVFLILKGIIWATQLYLAAYNVVMGFTGAITGKASIAIGENTIAMGAYRTTLGLTTAAQWLFNDSILAFKAGGISGYLSGIVAFGQKIGIIYLIVDALNELRKSFDSIMGSLANGDIWIGFSKFIRSVIVALMDLTSPLNYLLAALGKLTGIQWLKDLNTDQTRPMTDQQKEDYKNTGHWKPLAALPTPATKAQQVSVSSNNKSTVDINLNDPGGAVKSVVNSQGVNVNMPKITSTTGNK